MHSERDEQQGHMSDNHNPTANLSALYRETLGKLRHSSIEQLRVDFDLFFENLINHLFSLSSDAQQVTSGYNSFYEAMNAVKRNKSEITKTLIGELDSYYDDLTPTKKDANSEPTPDNAINGLNLVDIDEFEDHLKIDKLVTTGAKRYSTSLECLTIRLAQLVDADPHIIRVPIHVELIAKAFPKAMKGQGVPKDVMPSILSFFLKEFIEKLEEYYDSLNGIFCDAGIRPNLEREVEAKGTLLNRPPPNKRPPRKEPQVKSKESPASPANITTTSISAPAPLEISTTQSTLSAEPSTAATSTGPLSHDSLYNSVISALNFKRESDALLSASGASGHSSVSTGANSGNAGTSGQTANLADAPSIAQVLNSLQQNSEVRAAVQASESLSDYLAANRSDISGLAHTTGLSPDSINQIDLVDKLFGTIKSRVDVTSELKPALADLQIPLAKLALLEPRFFVDQEHPARGVVDKLAKLCSSANFPNKTLENRIGRIIQDIVNDYDNDSAIFDIALKSVDKLVTQQDRAQQRNIERVVKTQEGQEKLREAHLAVKKEIDTQITFPAAPRVLIDLVDSGWRELLVLTYIREGEYSKTWREHVKTLNILCVWLTEQETESVDEDVLIERSLEAEPLLDMVGQQISAALPTNVTHEGVLGQLRDIFAGKQTVSMAPISPLQDSEKRPAEKIAEKISSLPRIRRWVQRVNQLEKGTWLNYKDKEGQKKRMQLAWISAERDRYIFVNERGQRHADLTSVKLARQLSRGTRPLVPTDKLSLVDQSMYDTLEHVQKSLSFARNHDSLTRLINIDTFLLQVGRALRHAQIKMSQHAILHLNIDKFTLVNEVYDRENGDIVLLEFAKLLAQLHGKKSSSTRIENDEFAILLLDMSVEQAVQYAEKIRQDIETSIVDINDEKVTFTVSIGVAPIRDYSPSVDEVMKFASSAAALAKERGRNQVVEFEQDQSEIDRYCIKQQAARTKIEHILETNRFVLRAQPIVQSTVDGSAPQTQHYEILLGMGNKDGTISSPQEFIESAENYGYMGLVDRWVVKEAFSWINHLMDRQKVVPSLSINLSGSSITDDSFLDYLLEQISEFGVGTSKLCFEITETGTISNLIKAADFVRSFRNLGCRFSIDDFGTGLASHNYLRELPVDYVKIDGTFITEIDSNRNDYAMTRSINDLAHFLGQKTIAESVENGDIIKKLNEIGVDYLQGWGVGKPKLLEEIASSLPNIAK
jgi:diguanylate cyclase (GGDEF)-like protein